MDVGRSMSKDLGEWRGKVDEKIFFFFCLLNGVIKKAGGNFREGSSRGSFCRP